jgi:hypothetical protein
MLAAPMARQQKKKLAADTTGSAGTTGVPCAMVLTVSFVLLGTGLSCSHRTRDHHLTCLTPASGCQDHTTSPSAKTPFVRTSDRARRQSVHRSPASRVVTIAMRPSSSRRDARRIHIFLENGSKIFSREDWMTESSQSALTRLANFDFFARGIVDSPRHAMAGSTRSIGQFGRISCPPLPLPLSAIRRGFLVPELRRGIYGRLCQRNAQNRPTLPGRQPKCCDHAAAAA